MYKGGLQKRDGEILVNLFDHAILFTKIAKNKHHEHLRVYRKVGSPGMVLLYFRPDPPCPISQYHSNSSPSLSQKIYQTHVMGPFAHANKRDS